MILSTPGRSALADRDTYPTQTAMSTSNIPADLCCFLDRPAFGGRNAADDLYDAEYVCELDRAAIIGMVGVPAPASDITECEAATLFALGFGLEQAAAGLELLRSAGVTDETVFADPRIEDLREKFRSEPLRELAREWYGGSL